MKTQLRLIVFLFIFIHTSFAQSIFIDFRNQQNEAYNYLIQSKANSITTGGINARTDLLVPYNSQDISFNILITDKNQNHILELQNVTFSNNRLKAQTISGNACVILTQLLIRDFRLRNRPTLEINLRNLNCPIDNSTNEYITL